MTLIRVLDISLDQNQIYSYAIDPSKKEIECFSLIFSTDKRKQMIDLFMEVELSFSRIPPGD